VLNGTREGPGTFTLCYGSCSASGGFGVPAEAILDQRRERVVIGNAEMIMAENSPVWIFADWSLSILRYAA